MEPERSVLQVAVALILLLVLPTQLLAADVNVPAGTRIYGELEEKVSSKKKETTVGDIIRACVWRDVIVEGRVVIKAGTPMITRVSMVKPAKIAGRKGDVHLEAVSTTAVDGTEVLLDGGYDKSGKGKKALAWSLFALVAWPLVFIKGKNAFLEPGTVFDGQIQGGYDVAIGAAEPFAIQLGDTAQSELSAEILYDEMDPEAKQKTLPLTLKACGIEIESASVVTVNDRPIEPIPVSLQGGVTIESCTETAATISLEPLAKHFGKGINRFEIQAQDLRCELIVEIEL